ncbi:GTP pyrophosphokinase [Tindallia californiensis]|uniref:Putative GTP pyrophosphokinase n=1 Tax=Tindallia californiensis TaxID=159292 RepID=A0A1H3IT53_9FIRM|nr:GTP pyrophosphokinase family protein [Tindallia californiensis]SDY30044.1 putative GTP pyrophosphokinase [Tindallia californiensis]
MENIEWNKFLIPYENAVEELKVKFKSIRSELLIVGAYSPIEFVVGRVKKVSSILEKAKLLDLELDEVENGIEDIAGIRIMCQFVEDIYTVMDYIYEREGKDMEIVAVKDYITNQKESGYRSYHVVVRYPIQTAFGHKKILAEIQIRTLAMNFWATIEHSLNYKYKKRIPDHVTKRLKKAADAAMVLDQEMSEIRYEIREAQKMFEIKSNIVSNVLSLIQKLRVRGLHSQAEKYYSEFESLWEQGEMIELKKLAYKLRAAVDQYDLNEEQKKPE